MAVDDVAVLAADAKRVHDVVADFGGVAQLIVPALLLGVGFLLGNEVSLEGGHLALVEEGRIGSAPEVPEEVACRAALPFFGFVIEGCAHEGFDAAHQFHTLGLAIAHNGFAQAAVFVERHGGVEEQVAIVDAIHTAVEQEASHVAVQAVADAERMGQAPHQFVLLGREAVGMLRVDGREGRIAHGVGLSVEGERACRMVNVFQQTTVVHVPFGVGHIERLLEFELDDGNGLVHLRHEANLFLVGVFAAVFKSRLEDFARVIGIGLHGKGGQGHHVDAISFLQCLRIGIAQAEAQNAGDATEVASRCSHPQHVVVAPLDVDVVEVAERVHDEVCARTAVVNVAEDVQAVNGQALDEIAEGDDEVVGAARADDGADDDVEVGLLVVVIGTLVQEFLNNIGVFLGQALAHLRAGVFRRDAAADGDKLVECGLVIVVEGALVLLDEFQFLLGIINERTEVLLLLLAQGIAEEVVDLALDITRSVAQHVLEGFVLTVEVGQEVLGRLGQMEDGLEVDNLGGDARHGGEIARQQSQVSQVVLDGLFVGGRCAHSEDWIARE